MSSRPLNQFQSPPSTPYPRTNQMLSETIHTVITTNRNQPNHRENITIANSPYYSTPGPITQSPSKGERIVVNNYQPLHISNNVSNQRSTYIDVEPVEIKPNVNAKQIQNKYGLGVWKFDKSPRNSHTETDIKQNGQRSTVTNVTNNAIINERKTYESVRAYTPIKSFVSREQGPLEDKQILQTKNNQVVLQPVQYSQPSTPKNESGIAFPGQKVVSSSWQNHQNVVIEPLQSKIKLIEQGSGEMVKMELDGIGSYEGMFKNNAMHGYGRLFDSKNRLVYEGEFADNHFEGLGVLNNFQEEQTQSSVLNGQSIVLPLDWIRFEGLFHESKKFGMSYMFFADGSSFLGEFENDSANGFGSFVGVNGDSIKGTWNNNVLLNRS